MTDCNHVYRYNVEIVKDKYLDGILTLLLNGFLIQYKLRKTDSQLWLDLSRELNLKEICKIKLRTITNTHSIITIEKNSYIIIDILTKGENTASYGTKLTSDQGFSFKEIVSDVITKIGYLDEIKIIEEL